MYRQYQKGTIYGLADPRTGEIRYVGRTATPLKRRLQGHLTKARNQSTAQPCCFWIREVLGTGAEPLMIALEENCESALEAEQRWIEQLRAAGSDLLNAYAGGEGARNPVPESRQRMSDARKGKKETPEHRANIGKALKGRVLSPQSRKKIGDTQRGKKLTAEHKAKISAAHTGKTLSPEHKAKLSAAGMGRIPSPEAITKSANSRRGRPMKPRSPEMNAAVGAKLRGRKHSPERIAKAAAGWARRRQAANTAIAPPSPAADKTQD